MVMVTENFPESVKKKTLYCKKIEIRIKMYLKEDTEDKMLRMHEYTGRVE